MTSLPHWTNVVTLGNVASVVIVAAVILIVLRRELRSEWREAAESRGARIDDLEERIGELEATVRGQAATITDLRIENAELRSRPSLEQVEAALEQAAAQRREQSELLAASASAIAQVERTLDEHVTPNLEKISTVLVDLVAIVHHRSPKSRTRSTDHPHRPHPNTGGAPT